MAVDQVAIVPRTRQYPHLDRIGDDASYQSLRLLWDQIFSLQERLTAAEATITALLSTVNALESTAAQQAREGQATLAEEQQP